MTRFSSSEHAPAAPGAVRRRWRLLLAGALLACAMIFGGGGTPAPRTELVVQLAATVILACWAWLSTGEERRGVDWPLTALLLALPIIGIIQLVPLPPTVWQSLPGREIEIEALALIDAANRWMPLSVSPARTLAAVLSFVAPLVLAGLTMRLDLRSRTYLLLVLGILGAVAATVGVVQLASDDANLLRLYSYTQYGYATGFQASRNAQADILLLAVMAMLSALAILRRRAERPQPIMVLGLACITLIALSLVMTGSRAGIAMLVIVAVQALILFARRRFSGRQLFVALAVGSAVIASAGFALKDNPRIQKSITRFDSIQDVRPKIWEDSLYVIEQTFPAGAGLGTFQTVFPAAERLEFIRPSFPNRAHNDYLELLIETGVAGLLVLFAGGVFLLWRIITLWRDNRGSEERVQIIFVVALAVEIILHSIVDYPLRSMSVACIAGMATGLLSRAPDAVRPARDDRQRGIAKTRRTGRRRTAR